MTISSSLELVIGLAKAQAVINKRFDSGLSIHGLSFNDFIILSYLAHAPGNKLRRIDLADKMGITASGITRMLAPMEKIGLVGRETNERDARVSYVVLANGGRRVFEESLKAAEYAANAVIPANAFKKIDKLAELINEIIK